MIGAFSSGISRRQFLRSLAVTTAAIPVTRLWADTASGASTPAVTGTGKPISLSAADIKDLRGSLRGKVLLAQDAGYDTARRLWNPMFDRRPAVIARCAGPADVATAVKFARAHDLLTSVRGGGHSLSGQSACDRGLMIDLSLMKDIRLDAQRGVGSAQGGVLLGELDRRTQQAGLATTLGTATDTGIAGLTLGGGMGRLMRKYGLACDNLQSVEIVTADGRVLRASERDNPDLFWAVRGGGGNFGVVTAFEYRLHRLGNKVLDGALIYSYDKAVNVHEAAYELGQRAPDDLLLGVELLNFPPGTERPGRSAVIGVTYLGDPAEGTRLLEPLKKLGTPVADLITAKTYLEAQGALVADAPVAAPSATGGAPSYTKTGFLRSSSTELFSELVKRFGALPDSLNAVTLWGQLGGAVARVPKEATAFWSRHAEHDLLIGGSWSDRTQDEPYIKALRGVWSGVEKFTEGFYVNTEPGADDARIRVTYGGNYARLRQLKSQYDPQNLFRLNANIKPA
jgi:FAD/FMN-containing dehydrogenase